MRCLHFGYSSIFEICNFYHKSPSLTYEHNFIEMSHFATISSLDQLPDVFIYYIRFPVTHVLDLLYRITKFNQVTSSAYYERMNIINCSIQSQILYDFLQYFPSSIWANSSLISINKQRFFVISVSSSGMEKG